MNFIISSIGFTQSDKVYTFTGDQLKQMWITYEQNELAKRVLDTLNNDQLQKLRLELRNQFISIIKSQDSTIIQQDGVIVDLKHTIELQTKDIDTLKVELIKARKKSWWESLWSFKILGVPVRTFGYLGAAAGGYYLATTTK